MVIIPAGFHIWGGEIRIVYPTWISGMVCLGSCWDLAQGKWTLEMHFQVAPTFPIESTFVVERYRFIRYWYRTKQSEGKAIEWTKTKTTLSLLLYYTRAKKKKKFQFPPRSLANCSAIPIK